MVLGRIKQLTVQLLDLFPQVCNKSCKKTFEGKHFALQSWAVETLDINHSLISHMGDSYCMPEVYMPLTVHYVLL